MNVGRGSDDGDKYASNYALLAKYPDVKKYSFNSFNVIENTGEKNVNRKQPGYSNKVVLIKRGELFLILFGEFKSGYIKKLLSSYTPNPKEN